MSDGAREHDDYRYLGAYPLGLLLLTGVVFGGVSGVVRLLGLRDEWVVLVGGPLLTLIAMGFCWFAWGPNGRWVDRRSADQ
jgi:hypothetical protein